MSWWQGKPRSAKAIAESAVTVEFRRQRLRILHPLQLLQAKIWNLFKLEGKRTPEGIEQARLAIEIAAAFTGQPGMSRKERLKAIEAIGRFAATDPARYARKHHGLECLKAVPASVLRPGVLPPAFHEKRWPQILAAGRAAGAR